MRIPIGNRRRPSLVSQSALVTEPDYIAFLSIAETIPVEALLATAHATKAVASRIRLTDTATGAGYREKL